VKKGLAVVAVADNTVDRLGRGVANQPANLSTTTLQRRGLAHVLPRGSPAARGSVHAGSHPMPITRPVARSLTISLHTRRHGSQPSGSPSKAFCRLWPVLIETPANPAAANSLQPSVPVADLCGAAVIGEAGGDPKVATLVSCCSARTGCRGGFHRPLRRISGRRGADPHPGTRWFGKLIEPLPK